jgi:hypothetical protein
MVPCVDEMESRMVDAVIDPPSDVLVPAMVMALEASFVMSMAADALMSALTTAPSVMLPLVTELAGSVTVPDPKLKVPAPFMVPEFTNVPLLVRVAPEMMEPEAP